MPVAAVGAALSVYHYLLEWFPRLDAGACSRTISCEFVWFRALGFATFSYIAVSGSPLIGVPLLTARIPSPSEH